MGPCGAITWLLNDVCIRLTELWPDPLFFVNEWMLYWFHLSVCQFVYWSFNDSSLLSFFFSPEKEKGLKKRAKLHPQENGEKSENGLSRENEERRENGDGDSDNEPEEVRERRCIHRIIHHKEKCNIVKLHGMNV